MDITSSCAVQSNSNSPTIFRAKLLWTIIGTIIGMSAFQQSGTRPAAIKREAPLRARLRRRSGELTRRRGAGEPRLPSIPLTCGVVQRGDGQLEAQVPAGVSAVAGAHGHPGLVGVHGEGGDQPCRGGEGEYGRAGLKHRAQFQLGRLIESEVGVWHCHSTIWMACWRHTYMQRRISCNVR